MNVSGAGYISLSKDQIQNMDIGTLRTLIGFNRITNTENAVRNQLSTVQANNDWMRQANEMLGQIAQLKQQASASGKATDMPQSMIDFYNANKGADGKALVMDNTGNDYKHSKDEWSVLETSLKGLMDSKSSMAQIDQMKLQTLNGKLSNAVEETTNGISKDEQTKKTIAGNMR